MKSTLFTLALACLSLASSGQSFLKRGLSAIDESSSRSQLEFLASDAMQGRLMGSPYAAIAAEYISSELKRLGYAIEEQAFEGRNGVRLKNIFAVYKGLDSSKRYLIGAHYDHLGVDKSGDVYNGADDNASGVVAVLQIAAALKAADKQPAVDIVLAFWDGEEQGLQGSRYYVANAGNLDTLVGYMNFDLIGRNTDESNPGLFRYFYSSKSPQYKSYMEHAISKWGLVGLKPDFRGAGDDLGGSDNASFNRKGVPIIWYHTDGHIDFHKTSDTAEKINWVKMMDIIRSAYLVSWSVANSY